MSRTKNYRGYIHYPKYHKFTPQYYTCVSYIPGKTDELILINWIKVLILINPYKDQAIQLLFGPLNTSHNKKTTGLKTFHIML